MEKGSRATSGPRRPCASKGIDQSAIPTVLLRLLVLLLVALPTVLPTAPTTKPTSRPTARPSTAAPTHSVQLGALRDLWTALGGTAQLGLASWHWEAEFGSKGGNFSLMCTSWVGISCADGKRVTGISLPSGALRGTLPSTIGALTTLQLLNLANNNLRGTLPAGLSRLSALQHLNLANNRFSGPINWAAILSLSHLTFLGLDGNVFAPPALEAAMTDALLTTGLPSLREVHIDAPQLLDSYNATLAQQQVLYDALQLPSSFLSALARVTPAGFDPIEAIVSDPARTLANMRNVKIVRSERASAVGVRVQTARIAQPAPPVEEVPTPSPSSSPTPEPSSLPTTAPTAPTATPSVVATALTAAPTFFPPVFSLDAASYSGSGAWVDSVGGKAFTLYGGPAYSATVGGGSFLFQGGSSGQYAQTSAALPSMSQWTVEVWHYYTGTEKSGNGTAIVTDISGSAASGYLTNFILGRQDTHGQRVVATNYVNSVWQNAAPSAGASLTVGDWHHIVATFSSSTLRLYIDGVLAGSSSSNTAAAISGGAGIGLMRRWDNEVWAKTYNWGGRLAIVRIYDVALSSTVVLASYNQDKARFTSTPTSVLSAYSTSPYQIAANNLVGTVALPSQYIISFDVQFSSFNSKWQSFIQLTGDNTYDGAELSRMPVIQTCPGGYCCNGCINIAHRNNPANSNEDVYTSALTTNTWYTFAIVMDFASGQMSLSVIPAGGSGEKCDKCSATLGGISQKTFSAMKVWATTPSHGGTDGVPNASIRNLAIKAPSNSSDTLRINGGTWPEFGQTGWPSTGDNTGGNGQTNINVALSATNSGSQSIVISAIMYYKTVAGNAAMTTARVGGIYSVSGTTGTLLGSTVTFTGETSSGWQSQALPTPVTIAAAKSFHAVVNMRSYVSSIFPSTTVGTVTNLCAYYSYSATIEFPMNAQCIDGYNRMIDIVYTVAA